MNRFLSPWSLAQGKHAADGGHNDATRGPSTCTASAAPGHGGIVTPTAANGRL
jgi:hypothetical protein